MTDIRSVDVLLIRITVRTSCVDTFGIRVDVVADGVTALCIIGLIIVVSVLVWVVERR
jgi:hypothetical protein